MTLSTQTNDLLNDLIIADASDNGSPLAPGTRPALEAALSRCLIDYDRLNDHIRFLQKQLGSRFRHRGLLDETTNEAVLHGGLAVLDDASLARLALNPIALTGLADEIEERRPAAWEEALGENSLELLHAHGRSIPSLEEVLGQPLDGLLGKPKRTAEHLAVGCLDRSEASASSWRFEKPAAECEWLAGNANAAENIPATVKAEWQAGEGVLLVSVGGLLRQGPGARVEATWRSADGSSLATVSIDGQFGLMHLLSPPKQSPQVGERLEVRNVWQPTTGAGWDVRVVLVF